MTLTQSMSQSCDKSLDNAMTAFIACPCTIMVNLHSIANSARLPTGFAGPAKYDCILSHMFHLSRYGFPFSLQPQS
jgi:hypothetical protein